jgi:hypothetical protein
MSPEVWIPAGLLLGAILIGAVISVAREARRDRTAMPERRPPVPLMRLVEVQDLMLAIAGAVRAVRAARLECQQTGGDAGPGGEDLPTLAALLINTMALTFSIDDAELHCRFGEAAQIVGTTLRLDGADPAWRDVLDDLDVAVERFNARARVLFDHADA